MLGFLAMQGLPVRADDALEALIKDPKNWASPTQNDANTRFSTLNQITAANVKKSPGRLDVFDRRASRP